VVRINGGGKVMPNNKSAGSGKKDTMSLTLALIVLDRLNTTERIDVTRDNLAEAVRVVSAAAKYRITQKPEKSKSYWASLKMKTCPTCKYTIFSGIPRFCPHCGQALDWR
jgi:rubrerythrin